LLEKAHSLTGRDKEEDFKNHTAILQVWNSFKMKSEVSMQIEGLVTCAAGAKDYFFVGIYEPSSINIYSIETY
jgi:hypothetical protein